LTEPATLKNLTVHLNLVLNIRVIIWRKFFFINTITTGIWCRPYSCHRDDLESKDGERRVEYCNRSFPAGFRATVWS